MRKVSLPINRTMHFPIRRPWIPYIILFISLLITLLSTLFVIRSAEDRDRLRFESAVDQTQDTIANRVDTYVALLRGGSGLLAAKNDVSEEEFRLFVNRLQLVTRYPGIQGIGYAPRVTEQEKQDFELYARSAFNESYTINPSGEREEYFPILYLEPKDYLNNRVAPGFDGFSDPIRRKAMERARDTGTITASGKVQLSPIEAQTNPAGVIIYSPIYETGEIPQTIEERRESIRGFIYSPLRADDLFKGIFVNQSQLLINVQIYDGTKKDDTKLLHYTHTQTNTVHAINPIYTEQRTLDISGTPWTISYESNAQFDSQSQRWLAPFILTLGLATSAIVFIMSRAQFLARTTAEQTATKLLHSQLDLKRAIGMRDDFISIASHELKTPVTSMKLFAEVMQKKFIKEKQHDAVLGMEKINIQIDKLTVLIQDLLDVTRIQSGKLTFHNEFFSIQQIVQEAIESTQPLSTKHTIILKSSADARVWGDKERIGQVVTNFLTNAIKYSPDANKVNVSIQKTRTKLKVAVQDFGIGIDQTYQKKVFTRFYRVTEKGGNTFPGLGIGLYICSEIIKRHDGEISVISTKGKGSIFQFTIPLQKKK